jgi:hypothetical protein
VILWLDDKNVTHHAPLIIVFPETLTRLGMRVILTQKSLMSSADITR